MANFNKSLFFVKTNLLRDIRPESIIRALKKGWFQEFGRLESILTDQGRRFIATLFKTFLKQEEIIHHMTTAYNPQGNRITERTNQEITKLLRITCHRPTKQALNLLNRA